MSSVCLYRPSPAGTRAARGCYQLLPYRESGSLFFSSIKTYLPHLFCWCGQVQGLTNSPQNSDLSIQRRMNNELVRSCAGKREGVKKTTSGLIFLCTPPLAGGGQAEKGMAKPLENKLI